MRRTQSDHTRLDLLPLVIWSRAFWPPVTWNLRKAQHLTKIVLTFNRCRPHSVTFGYGGRQEEPSILISRLLIRMRRMYVASIRFGLPLRMNGMYRTQFEQECLDLLPLAIWSRVFWPSATLKLKQRTALEQKRLTFNLCDPHFLTFGRLLLVLNMVWIKTDRQIVKQHNIKSIRFFLR